MDSQAQGGRVQDANGPKGLIMTSTGAYNIDYEAAYAARKFENFSNPPMARGTEPED